MVEIKLKHALTLYFLPRYRGFSVYVKWLHYRKRNKDKLETRQGALCLLSWKTVKSNQVLLHLLPRLRLHLNSQLTSLQGCVCGRGKQAWPDNPSIVRQQLQIDFGASFGVSVSVDACRRNSRDSMHPSLLNLLNCAWRRSRDWSGRGNVSRCILPLLSPR